MPRQILCLIPSDLEPEVEVALRHFFGPGGPVEVMVERRLNERRSDDRRAAAPPDASLLEPGEATFAGLDVAPDGPDAPPAEQPFDSDRRRVRNPTGRRAGERRATLAPADPPALPREAKPCLERLVFVQRLAPLPEYVEDLQTRRLVIRAQGGEEGAFGELYTLWFDRVYAYHRIALTDSHEAEDATQEVFINALEALPAYQMRAVPFEAWLFRIARNRTINLARRRGRLDVEDPRAIDRRIELDTPLHLLPTDELGTLDPLSDLTPLIERLPLPQRQVILLRHMVGLSSAQIAEVLNRSPASVRQLQTRAFRSLRQRLIATGKAPKPKPDEEEKAGAKSAPAKPGDRTKASEQSQPPLEMSRMPGAKPVLRARRHALIR